MRAVVGRRSATVGRRETACETIGLAFRRLVREIADLHELLDQQPKESVLH
jgi:hypothetical protein